MQSENRKKLAEMLVLFQSLFHKHDEAINDLDAVHFLVIADSGIEWDDTKGRIICYEDWCYKCGEYLLWNKCVCSECCTQLGVYIEPPIVQPIYLFL